jgi:APA family basic amino acid/polyamine antiporter
MINEQSDRQVSGLGAAPVVGTASRVRKTLGLTGITIHAMALIAPGAFMWLLYQAQAASVFSGAADIWPGVFAALILSLLTARSLGELARRYPDAGLRSAYHYAERVFREDQARPGSHSAARWAKQITGWSAHLYYWIYPGVLVAFTGVLTDYLLRQFGYRPTIFGDLILTFSFSALVGFLALRGISGSTTSSVVLNVIQISTLVFFGGAAILFRMLNPLSIPASEWIHPGALAIVLPKSGAGLIFQAALALILMVGFEASTTLSASAKNAARDIPRAAVLTLVIQGAFAYLFEYFATGMALNRHPVGGLETLAGSPIPVGDLAIQIGNALLGGNGSTILLTIGFTIYVALLGSALTALNNGVRVSFSMALDAEMPSVLSFLHPRFATPYVAVILLSSVSALIGSIGVLGGLPALMGIILATNLGAFVLYAMLCLLTVVAYRKSTEFNFIRHGLFPGVGFMVNAGTALTFPVVGILAGGIPAQASAIALLLAAAWLLLSLVYLSIHKG